MAKKAVRINWKALVRERERRIEALSAANELLNKEIDAANAQMKQLGSQLAEVGSARVALGKKIDVARATIKGAAETIQSSGQTDLAAALYAQAEAL